MLGFTTEPGDARAFFKGKTMTYIVATDSGGDNTAIARVA